MEKYITIKGAREHNLQNVNAKIPKNKITVITGVSGSGKSTLAFNTLYAEGQRRYVNSLSSYARMFLGVMKKPDVDSIVGLCPAISIDQKSMSSNPRSTVGTTTEIYDYLRLLFARVGVAHCPECGRKIQKQSTDSIISNLLSREDIENKQLLVLSPIVRSQKGEFHELFKSLFRQGFSRVIVDEKMHKTKESIDLEKNTKHDISIVVDRLEIDKDNKDFLFRLKQAVDKSCNEAEGLVILRVLSGRVHEDYVYSKRYACIKCNVNIPEYSPRMFSFNNPFGACPSCQGLGAKIDFDEDLVIPDRNLSIIDGAIAPWSSKSTTTYYIQKLKSVGAYFGFDIFTPIKKIPKDKMEVILYGSKGISIKTIYQHQKNPGSWTTFSAYEGVIPNLRRMLKDTKSEYVKNKLMKFIKEKKCPECDGKRLKKEVLCVKILDKSIMDICDMPIRKSLEFFQTIGAKISMQELKIAERIVSEMINRLECLENIGLSYLSLSRMTKTLSGGEAQRIRLATQIGTNLSGILYVFDEPSIGLHPRDNSKLIKMLKKIKDNDNTIVVVEHDRNMITESDYILDLGPGAGIHGGKIIAQGTPKEIICNEKSITGMYLKDIYKIKAPGRRRTSDTFLELKGATEHNLKNIDIKIPLGCLVCITGVSGSGKSSLLCDTLIPAVKNQLNGSSLKTGKHADLLGVRHLDKIVEINQTAIGRTPRSNPATYVGLFTYIRELFARTKDSQMNGFCVGHFSFNTVYGRCETCRGDGQIKIEMQFMEDLFVVCEVCGGKRYTKEVLEVKYKGKNIFDVLEMTTEEAIEFFKNIPAIRRKLQTLIDVGLGYVKLGQSSATLSGGEAQRIKLSKELSKMDTGKTLYILDEPTTGLHFDDIKKLIRVLNNLIEKGNTIVIIEHNLDVVKQADYIIDLGPEGGEFGGEIVGVGTPEEIARNSASHTGGFLKRVLE
ncbi:MAG: excinuclease ABC subunit UvrA [Candidatus Aenigmarchaeota archaeon]|nr:excinuclease ABC subunit UvrA [Candidatus Aenigmarchaeota archaeon]